MVTSAHLEKGDNLRLVRPEYRPSARAAIKLLQALEHDESYWLRMTKPKDDNDKPRR